MQDLLIITQDQFDSFPIVGGYRICPVGDYSKLKIVFERCKFGNGNKFGNENEYGNEYKYGNKFEFGVIVLGGFEFVKSFQMQNLDGTGRQIWILFSDKKDVCISAERFLGTLEEFYAKAQSENKHFYANVVRAAAEAYLKTMEVERA